MNFYIKTVFNIDWLEDNVNNYMPTPTNSVESKNIISNGKYGVIRKYILLQ